MSSVSGSALMRAAHLEAVELGHHDVEQHQVRPCAPCDLRAPLRRPLRRESGDRFRAACARAPADSRDCRPRRESSPVAVAKLRGSSESQSTARRVPSSTASERRQIAKTVEIEVRDQSCDPLAEGGLRRCRHSRAPGRGPRGPSRRRWRPLRLMRVAISRRCEASASSRVRRQAGPAPIPSRIAHPGGSAARQTTTRHGQVSRDSRRNRPRGRPARIAERARRHGDDRDVRRGRVCSETPSRLQPIEIAHLEVHEDHVGAILPS